MNEARENGGSTNNRRRRRTRRRRRRRRIRTRTGIIMRANAQIKAK